MYIRITVSVVMACIISILLLMDNAYAYMQQHHQQNYIHKNKNVNHKSKLYALQHRRNGNNEESESLIDDYKNKLFRSMIFNNNVNDNVKKQVFGFTRDAEIINGRLAVIGLISAYVKEYFTGQSIVEQVNELNSIGVPVNMIACLSITFAAGNLLIRTANSNNK